MDGVQILDPVLIAFTNNTETERTMRKINVNSRPMRAYAIISDPASFGLSNKQLMEKHGIRDSVFYAARRKHPEFKHQKPVVVREPKPRKRTQLGTLLSLLSNLKPSGNTDVATSLAQIAAMLQLDGER